MQKVMRRRVKKPPDEFWRNYELLLTFSHLTKQYRPLLKYRQLLKEYGLIDRAATNLKIKVIIIKWSGAKKELVHLLLTESICHFPINVVSSYTRMFKSWFGDKKGQFQPKVHYKSIIWLMFGDLLGFIKSKSTKQF